MVGDHHSGLIAELYQYAFTQLVKGASDEAIFIVAHVVRGTRVCHPLAHLQDGSCGEGSRVS